MKNFFSILWMVLFLVSCSEEREVSYLHDKNGLKFEPNLEKPFTGKHVTHYANGKKMSETSYKEGRIDGLWTWWYEMRSKMEEGILQGHEERGAVDFMV